MRGIRSIRDVEVSGKRVLLRTSLNVPVAEDGTVGDLFRLKRALPTIEYLAKQGAKIIIVGYIGRAGATLAPVAQALQKLAPNISIRFSDAKVVEGSRQHTPEKVLGSPQRQPEEVGLGPDYFHEHTAATPPRALVDEIKPGECLMLENIRLEPGEEKNDPALAQALAKLADIFVSDSFAEAHREYASNVGVAKLLPSYSGFLLEEEIDRLSEALNPPEHSIAMVGGAKFDTKEPLLSKLVARYEKILLGGALADDMIKMRGMPVGASLVSDSPVPTVLAMDTKISVPVDAVVNEVGMQTERISLINDIRADERIVDIGPQTSIGWSGEVVNAPFILWNGPMGIYEEGYVQGTDALAEALSHAAGRAAVGGGDTAAALAQFSFDPTRVFISTGGGAMLQFLTDGTLPGIEALKQ